MRLHLAAIGRLTSGPEKALADDYASRIQALCRQAGIKGLTIAEKQESQRSSVAERQGEEAAALLEALPERCDMIVFDERGKAVSSSEFANMLRRRIDAGLGDLALLIGGPDGFSPGIREKASAVIALGTMTWPHRLVRIMVLEQAYRALTILLHHPYHRA